MINTYFGDRVARYEDEARDVIGELEMSPAGNLVIRVGRENHPDGAGWHQTGHIVLTPDEHRDLIVALRGLEGETGTSRSVGIYDVTVETGVVPTRFEVYTGDPAVVNRYGETAEEIARAVAAEFCDSGTVLVKSRIGNDRVVLGRVSARR